MNKAFCSNGERVSQATIDRRRGECHREMYEGEPRPMCRCGCGGPAVHNDHTIAQARCKQLKKSELIWDPENNVPSCERSHSNWEAVKGGAWALHRNAPERLAYLFEHDQQGYTVRVEIMKEMIETLKTKTS